VIEFKESIKFIKTLKMLLSFSLSAQNVIKRTDYKS